jgi:predicted permease
MMLMVIVGYGAVKSHVIESDDSKTLSRLIVYILQPCLICRSFQIDLTPERLHGFLCALGLGFGTYTIWIMSLEVLKKPLKLDAVDRCSMIYSNVGNLALPLINMIMGSEYVFYASALQVPFNAFVWTHGNSVISGEKHLHFKKTILNPNVLAMIAGLFLTSLRIRLPDAVVVSPLPSTVDPVIAKAPSDCQIMVPLSLPLVIAESAIVTEPLVVLRISELSVDTDGPVTVQFFMDRFPLVFPEISTTLPFALPPV